MQYAKLNVRLHTANDVDLDEVMDLDAITSRAWSKKMFQRFIVDPNYHVLIAESCNQIVAFVIYRKKPTFISRLVIHPDFDKKGMKDILYEYIYPKNRVSKYIKEIWPDLP